MSSSKVALLYEPKGVEVARTLWEETMAELSFARVAEIVQNLGKEDMTA